MQWSELERFVMHQPTPAARLAAAAVVQALKDAAAGDRDAVGWIDAHAGWLGALGLDAGALVEGIRAAELVPTI